MARSRVPLWPIRDYSAILSVLLVGLALSWGCGEVATQEGCVVDDGRRCDCDGGADGFQICLADQQWDACVCGDIDLGLQPDISPTDTGQDDQTTEEDTASDTNSDLALDVADTSEDTTASDTAQDVREDAPDVVDADCEPAARRCTDQTVEICDVAGQNWDRLVTCMLPQLCALGACTDRPENFGEDCDVDTPCGDDALTCITGVCLTVEPGGLGDQCWDDLECGDSNPECHQHTCQIGTVGDPCDDGNDCQAGLLCAGGQCQLGSVGDFCDVPADCLEVLVCGPEGCQQGLEGDDCTNGTHCSLLAPICAIAGNCQNGGAGDSCSDDLDCAESHPICGVGVCHQGLEGDDCEVGADCLDFCSSLDLCSDGGAGDVCGASGDCVSPTPICSLEGRCQSADEGEPCEASEDCSDGAPICFADSCQDGSAGDACGDGLDCAELNYCLGELCYSGGGRDPCENSAQCQDAVDICGPEGCQAGDAGEPCDDEADCNAGASICTAAELCSAGELGDDCGTNSDCDPDYPICGPSGCHQGLELDSCTVETHCASGLYCDPSGFCRDGSLGDPCDIDGGGECAVGAPVCDSSTELCRVRREGDDCDVGCPDGLYCASGTCWDGTQGDDCNGTSDCAVATLICGAGSCEPRREGDLCASNPECPDGLFCADDQCSDGAVGSSCDSNSDCSDSTAYCNPSDRCELRDIGAPCSSTPQCDQGFCANGECSDGGAGSFCNATSDCEQITHICGPDPDAGGPAICRTRVISDSCDNSDQCPGVWFCATNECWDGQNSGNCNNTSDCNNAEAFCDTDLAIPICRDRGDGSPCLTLGGGDCPDALYCADEDGGRYCTDGDTGDGCNNDSNCQDGEDICRNDAGIDKCLPRQIGDTCGSDSECPGAWYCASSECWDGQTGGNCNNTSDCDDAEAFCDTDPAIPICTDRGDGSPCLTLGGGDCPDALYCADEDGGRYCTDGDTGDGCNNDSNCQDGEDICRNDAGIDKCLPRQIGDACGSDSECPGAWYCASSECWDGQTGGNCNNTSDCDDNYDFCDTATTTPTCVRRVDGDPCQTPGADECPGSLYCADESGGETRCTDGDTGDGCNSDSDCDNEEDVCRNDSGFDACLPRLLGDTCDSDSECPGLWYCASDECWDGTNGGNCNQDSDCIEEYSFCDLGPNPICAERQDRDPCSDPGGGDECPPPLYCAVEGLGSRCTQGNSGDGCNQQSDCIEPQDVCFDRGIGWKTCGPLTGSCDVDEDCPEFPLEFCIGGECIPI